MYKYLSNNVGAKIINRPNTIFNKLFDWIYPKIPFFIQKLIPNSMRLGLLPNCLDLSNMKSVDTRLVNKFLYPINYSYFKDNGLPRPFNYLMVTSLIEDKDVPGNLVNILRDQDDEYEYWRFYGDSRDNWLNYEDNIIEFESSETDYTPFVYRVDKSFSFERFKILGKLDEADFNESMNILVNQGSQIQYLYTNLKISIVKDKVKDFVSRELKKNLRKLPLDHEITNKCFSILKNIMFVERFPLNSYSEDIIYMNSPIDPCLHDLEKLMHELIGHAGLRTCNYFPTNFKLDLVDKVIEESLSFIDFINVKTIKDLYYSYFNRGLNYNLGFHDFRLLFWDHPVFVDFIEKKQTFPTLTKIYADSVVNLMNDIRDSIEEQFDSIDKLQTHFFLNKILININQIQLDSTIESENPYRVSNLFQLIASDIFEIVKELPKSSIESFSGVDQEFLGQHIGLESFEKNGGNTYSYFTSSGCRAFNTVIDSIKKCFGEELKIHHFRDIYYEFSALLRQTKDLDPKIVQASDFKYISSEDIKVLCLDLRPNAATEKIYEPHDIDLILNYLKKDKSFHKILVIDTTTITPQESIFKDQFNKLLKAVCEDDISVITHQSLNKFQLLGLDIAPGGLIRILTKDEKLNSSLLWEIKKHTPHHYASNLYELFIKTCNDQVYSYQQLIINNTRKLYNLFHENELTTKDECRALYIGTVIGKDIPSYISVHFNYECIKKYLEIDSSTLFSDDFKYETLLYTLQQMLEYNKDDCNERSSFGFAKSNINDCQVSIRITCSPILNEIHLNRLCVSLQRVSDEINMAAQSIHENHSRMDGESKSKALLAKFNVNNQYDGYIL